jgi:hypothetical protein
MARDWRKSTVYTKWRAIWAYLKNNEERMLIGAETEILASNILIAIEGLIMRNEMLRHLFPELNVVNKGWTTKNKWSGRECSLPRRGEYTDPTFIAIGCGAAAQGRHPSKIFCLPTGNKIITSTGLKPIESLSRGNRVLSHTGEYLPVNKTFSREYSGDIVRIKSFSRNGDMTMTPEHPILILRDNGAERKVYFEKAKNITRDDFLAFPKIDNTIRFRTIFKSKNHFNDNKYWYSRVKSISSEPYLGIVYNIEVGGTHTYCSPFMISHNCDDIVGQKARDSAVVLQEAMRWLDNLKELCENPNFNDKDGSDIQIVGTRWGNGDIYDYIAENYPEYEFMIVPALRQNDEAIEQAKRGHKNMTFIQNPNVDIMESNWPESRKFTTEYYMNMLANPAQEIVAYAQHLNMPQKSSASNPLKYNWLNFYHMEDEGDTKWLICDDNPNEPRKNERYPLYAVPLYMVIDPGGFAEAGAVKRGSRVAYVIAGQAVNSHKKFIVETYSRRVMIPSEFFKDILAAYKKWRPRTMRIETIAAQEYIYKDVMEQALKAGVRIPLGRIAKDASSLQDKAKFRRISQLSTPGANGDIYVMKSMRDLIAEWANFDLNSVMPNDILDCLSWINQMYWSALPRNRASDINAQRDAEYRQRRNIT